MYMTKFKYSKNPSDEWLTPPELITACGPFDMDVCCPEYMPWKTATRIIIQKEDALKIEWKGKVWCNPPYSNILPWARRMKEHNNGIMLVPGKSTDTKWGQIVLSCDAVLFLAGRLLFHFPNGEKSKGKWLSNILCAFGKNNIEILKQVKLKFPGILMVAI